MGKANPCIAFQLFAVCWLVMAPFTLTLWFITLPKRLLSRMVFGKAKDEPKEANEITVKITEPKGVSQPKDEILLIHGFPDSGEMWDK